jgi:hypothetical protein
VLFVNGFHRSGTTVIASAATDALGGVTTTVGLLARHLPTLDTFLAVHADGMADRGADRLRITARTAEEYGFLLGHRTGTKSLYGSPAGVSVLREHVAELAALTPGRAIVLKNPWELGHEAQLLADFPNARIIILRRRLADVERSVGKALIRASGSAYSWAVEAGNPDYRRLQRQLASGWRRRLLLRALRIAIRIQAYRLSDTVQDLPLDRIAYLSYDEFRADPRAAAAWARHLIDPEALADAFTSHAFAERGTAERSTPIQRVLDRRWRQAWTRMRLAQVSAGILDQPSPHEQQAPSAVERYG